MRGDRFRRAITRRTGMTAIDELHEVGVNFDVDVSPLIEADGWKIDDYCVSLTAEEPGPPEPGGSWEVGCRLLSDYEFVDPEIVRAVYYPDHPLDGRDMLLEGRFLWMRFHLGVRVGGLIDLTEKIDGRLARRWGWSYRTLQGHLEMGQMDYEVRKWLDDGQVEFRIHAFSKAARIPNPVVRMGFQVFGRHMQQKFARHALDRMRRLVETELASLGVTPSAASPVRAAEHLRIESDAANPAHKERMEKTGEQS